MRRRSRSPRAAWAPTTSSRARCPRARRRGRRRPAPAPRTREAARRPRAGSRRTRPRHRGTGATPSGSHAVMRMHRSSRSPRSRHQPSQSLRARAGPPAAGATVAGGLRAPREGTPDAPIGTIIDPRPTRSGYGAQQTHAPGDVGVAASPRGGRAHRTAAKAMDGSIDTLAALLAMAGGAVANVFRRFDVPLLAAGLLLHLTADLVRNRGWYGVLRAVGPEHRDLRVRDVQAAAFAGGSVNAFVPARAGDLVKLAVLRRRAAGVAHADPDGDARAGDAVRVARGRGPALVGPRHGLPADRHRRRCAGRGGRAIRSPPRSSPPPAPSASSPRSPSSAAGRDGCRTSSRPASPSCASRGRTCRPS